MISDYEYNNIKLPSKTYQKIEEKVSMLYVEQCKGYNSGFK